MAFRVSLKFLYVIAAVLSCVLAIIVAWRLSLLQSYVEDSIGREDRDHASKVAMDFTLVAEIVRNDISRVMLYTRQTKIFAISVMEEQGLAAVSTSAAAIAAFNATLFKMWAPKVVIPGDIYGWCLDFLYPTGATSNFTSVQSFQTYADPSRLVPGTLIPMHSWCDPSSGTNLAYSLRYVEEGANGSALPQVVALDAMQYTFEWLPTAAETVGFANFFEVLPWVSMDGFPFWYYRHATHFVWQGQSVVVDSLGSSHLWAPAMQAQVSTPGALFFIFDDVNRLFTTNLPAERARLDNCSIADALTCLDVRLDASHPVPFVQDVYNDILRPARLGGLGPSNTSGFVDIGGTRYGYTLHLVVDQLQRQLYGIVMAPKAAPVSSDRSTVSLLMALVIIAAVLSTVVFGLVVYGSFLRPVDILVGRMQQVARLDFTGVAAKPEAHKLAEMTKLEKGYFDMATQLNRIKSFVPQSVLETLRISSSSDEEEDDADGEGDVTDSVDDRSNRNSFAHATPGRVGSSRYDGSHHDASPRNSQPGSPGSSSPSTPSRGAKPRQSTAAGHSAVDLSSFGLPQRQASDLHHGSPALSVTTAQSRGTTGSASKVERAIASSLLRKSVSMAVLNLTNFDALRDSFARLSDIQASFLHLVTKAATSSKGVVDYFQGDHVFVSFNAVRPSASHSRRAALLAWTVMKEALKRPDLPLVTAGISTGPATVGNMGTDAMKRFCIVGPVVPEAVALERLSSRYRPATPILFPQRLAEDISVEYLSQCVDIVVLTNSGKEEPVHALEGPKSMELNEWMYQLRQGENQDPFAALNDCFAALHRQQKDVASTIFDTRIRGVPAMDPARLPGIRKLASFLEKA